MEFFVSISAPLSPILHSYCCLLEGQLSFLSMTLEAKESRTNQNFIRCAIRNLVNYCELITEQERNANFGRGQQASLYVWIWILPGLYTYFMVSVKDAFCVCFSSPGILCLTCWYCYSLLSWWPIAIKTFTHVLIFTWAWYVLIRKYLLVVTCSCLCSHWWFKLWCYAAAFTSPLPAWLYGCVLGDLCIRYAGAVQAGKCLSVWPVLCWLAAEVEKT